MPPGIGGESDHRHVSPVVAERFCVNFLLGSERVLEDVGECRGFGSGGKGSIQKQSKLRPQAHVTSASDILPSNKQSHGSFDRGSKTIPKQVLFVTIQAVSERQIFSVRFLCCSLIDSQVIFASCFEPIVTEHFLDESDRAAIKQESCGASMTKNMWSNLF